MNYELRHFDTPLLRFHATEDSRYPEITITWINDSKRNLLPLDLETTGDGLSKWLKQRILPKSRAYSQNILSKCNLNMNRPLNIIRASKGLSLNDCYWVVEENFPRTFDELNLYDNRFSRVLEQIAFTGCGSSIRTLPASSPEFTTDGMLPKCWRRINQGIWLYKGGTKGASNTGNEPYSEYYAYRIAKILGVNAICYELHKWNGELCSGCKLFTGKDYAYMPAGKIITAGGMDAVMKYYADLGPEFSDALSDMIVFDAVICNTDRHYGNFGFLVDNHTNKIVMPAPLFDHGNSLFNYAGNDDLKSDDSLSAYANTLVPCLYDDFFSMAQKVLTAKHREGLRRLLDFTLKKHSRYNLPAKRLKRINHQVHLHAQKLLNGRD